MKGSCGYVCAKGLSFQIVDGYSLTRATERRCRRTSSTRKGSRVNVQFRFGKRLGASISRSPIFLACVAFCSLLGCGGGRVSPPYINATQAAAAAIEHYDTNGDGVITGAELDKAPGLRASRANHNGRITADDITERINRWQSDRVGLISFQTQVTLNGRPLGGATVRLVPEEFLAPPLKPAEGTTDENGVTIVSMKADELRKD